MTNTDIKNLGVFGTKNRGLDKIKDHYKTTSSKDVLLEKNINNLNEKRKKKKNVKNPKGAGAPIQNYDRAFATRSPLKLSALLNTISRNLVEKYETELSRDELLRKALDEYIKQNLSLEDKQELFSAVSKDLDIFREQNKTIPKKDAYGRIIKSVKEIEDETAYYLREQWGINK